MHSVPKGSETHFKVVIVSDQFEGVPLLERHRFSCAIVGFLTKSRKVNQVLDPELKGGVHALSIVAKTVKQWEQSGGTVPASPACMGTIWRLWLLTTNTKVEWQGKRNRRNELISLSRFCTITGNHWRVIQELQRRDKAVLQYSCHEEHRIMNYPLVTNNFEIENRSWIGKYNFNTLSGRCGLRGIIWGYYDLNDFSTSKSTKKFSGYLTIHIQLCQNSVWSRSCLPFALLTIRTVLLAILVHNTG